CVYTKNHLEWESHYVHNISNATSTSQAAEASHFLPDVSCRSAHHGVRRGNRVLPQTRATGGDHRNLHPRDSLTNGSKAGGVGWGPKGADARTGTALGGEHNPPR